MTFRTVKIGLVAPLSGESAGEGGRWALAARQAVDAWNADPAHGPVRKELVVLDEAEGEPAAKSLALDPQVLGVVGYARPTAAQSSLDRLAAAGMPVLVAGSEMEQHPAPAGGAGALYLAPPQAALAAGLANYAAGPLRARGVSMVVGPEPEDRIFGLAFREAAATAGISVREIPLPESPAETRTFADRLAANGFQAALLATSPGDARTLLPLIGARPRPLPVLLSPHAATGEAVKDVETLEVYWAAGTPDPLTVPGAKLFAGQYRSQTGTQPSVGAALVYDAVGLLLQGIEAPFRAGRMPSRASLQKTLRTTRETTGILRSYRFGDDGTVEGPGTFLFQVNRDQPFPGRQVASYPE